MAMAIHAASYLPRCVFTGAVHPQCFLGAVVQILVVSGPISGKLNLDIRTHQNVT